jgi:hypothetical protein
MYVYVYDKQVPRLNMTDPEYSDGSDDGCVPLHLAARWQHVAVMPCLSPIARRRSGVEVPRSAAVLCRVASADIAGDQQVCQAVGSSCTVRFR